MELPTLILVLGVVAGFLMAFSLGANDVANSMAAAVGSKAISLRQAVIIASLLNFVGAVFLGAHVAGTISRGIINPDMVLDHKMLMVGMFAALLSSGLWVLIATLTALPVSSTHSIVGSIIGFGLVVGGPGVINWSSLGMVVLSWLVSPFFGALIAYLVFILIRRYILYAKDAVAAALRWAPVWIGLTLNLIILSFCFKTPYGKKLGLTWPFGIVLAVVIMFVTVLVCRALLPRLIGGPGSALTKVDELFRRMQMGTACYVALSQGANDVANAIGPVVAIYMIATEQSMAHGVEVPVWLLVMGGVGIALGIVIMGYKVMGTVGEKLTKMNNTRGFAVAFGSATTVLMASNMGMPVSTTHATVGSVVGVGLARGFAAVDFRVLLKIVAYWLLTVPVAGFSCIVIFKLLQWILL